MVDANWTLRENGGHLNGMNTNFLQRHPENTDTSITAVNSSLVPLQNLGALRLHGSMISVQTFKKSL